MFILDFLFPLLIIIFIFVAVISENNDEGTNKWEANNGIIALFGFMVVPPPFIIFVINLTDIIFIQIGAGILIFVLYHLWTFKIKSKNPNVIQAIGLEVICLIFVIYAFLT